MKRRLALLLTMAMGISVLAGCGGDSGTKPEATEGNTEEVQDAQKTSDVSDSAGGDAETITMWGWNAGDIDKIFAAYKEKTGADVELEYVTVQQEESFQKLQTTISAGLDLPDIVPSEVGQRGTMLSLDIWEDLSQDPYNFDTSWIFPYQVPLCSNERGELVALPWDVSTAALAYKRPLALEYLGTEGTPVLRSDEGYSVVRYDYDAYGQTVSTLYYGIDMESLIFNQNYGCAGVQYKYDVYGNQTDVCYLGTDNQPILRKDQGFAHIAYQPDDFGNTVHQAYYADLEKNEPTTKKDKGYAYSLSDYQDGRCVETRFYNAQDELTLRLDGGYAIVRYEYDDFGRSLSRSYWGLDDTPVINTEEHYASVRWAYDERGNVTDTWYYGLDGNALCHSEYGYAHVHSQYNAMGNEVYAEFRDENDSLVSHKVYGYAYACYEFRNQDGQRHSTGNYYSPDGSPVQRKDLGFAGYEDIYDEHGNWIEGRCYDAQGDLVRRSDKDYAIIRMEYDSRNRCTRETYFDEYGEPTVSRIYGCAGFEYEYDEKF